jgi:hypothetical protein
LHNQVFRIRANRSPKSSIPTLSVIGIVHSTSSVLPIYTNPASTYVNKCTGRNCPDSLSIPKIPTKCQSGLVNGSLSSRYIQKLADTCNSSSSKASSGQSSSCRCSHNCSRLRLCTPVKLNPCRSSNTASSSYRIFKQ